MSQDKQKTPRNPEAREEAERRAAKHDEEAQAAPQDYVVIFKHKDEDGNIRTSVAQHGDVLVTEVETLLGLARNAWREANGL